MRPTLIHLVAFAPVLLLLLIAGTPACAATTQPPSDAKQLKVGKPGTDTGQLSEREKWSLARQAFDQAQAEEKRKDSEAAAYYYEVALELLGSLDMASIELPTHRVLAFQRRVLQRYDKFLATVESLPSTAGPVAVLESASPSDELSHGELPEKEPDVSEPVPEAITPNAPPLPEVPKSMNSQVAGQINFFMNKGRKVMLKWMERSAYMFPRLRPILQEEGIPEDVLFLAMIESGLNPKAYSYAHAAGVWQFIPGTGRIYGLNIDRVYDERLHIEASTRAACRYLRKLHDQFGDWFLAFAAYNCGEGRVEREIARSRTSNYWALKRLPKQTRGYVPAYLATREICKNPEKYGFPPCPAEMPFECEEVYVSGPYHLSNIAQAAGLDPSLVSELNPEFLRGVTPAGRAVRVRLPRKAHEEFETRLASMPKTSVQQESKSHRVRAGETWTSIARRYGTTVAELRAENRRIKSKRLKTGQTLRVPTLKVQNPGELQTADNSAANSKAAVTADASPADAKTKVDGSARQPVKDEIIYTVHRGETLGTISRQLGVSVAEICRQNKIKNPNRIQPGRKLRIKVSGGAEPQMAQTTPAEQPAATTLAQVKAPEPQNEKQSPQLHTVQRGDTVWSIARAYGQDPHKILSWNRLKRNSRIYPGQELIINQ